MNTLVRKGYRATSVAYGVTPIARHHQLVELNGDLKKNCSATTQARVRW